MLVLAMAAAGFSVGWLPDGGHPRLVFPASAGALPLCAMTMVPLGRVRRSEFVIAKRA